MEKRKTLNEKRVQFDLDYRPPEVTNCAECKYIVLDVESTEHTGNVHTHDQVVLQHVKAKASMSMLNES